jgi:hypothetical protein
VRYRALDANGDYVVGQQFLINSPACVAQAVMTRLRLWLGEFFVDTSDGTPWLTEVLGPRAGRSPDAAIKTRIVLTPNVTGLSAYDSNFDGTTRALTVTATLQTAYGPATISGTFP